ncbi:nucleotide exchange factor GrpE [Helicobacter winghamensis]
MQDNQHNDQDNLQETQMQDLQDCDNTAEDSANIEALQTQIAELKEQYVRAYADFENTKKRLERDKDQALEYAYEKIAKDLLPSIDALEIALKSIQDSRTNDATQNAIFSKIEEGIALTLDNLLKSLAKHGIEPIATDGAFDPNFHDAIMQVESAEHNAGDIVAVMQKGYTYKERVLRPSMVSIAK